MARTRTSSRALTDHQEIRRWAEERGATPASVRGTGGNEDVGTIRLDFPAYSGAYKLEEISWDDWFEKFDEHHLALLVQGETASGERSNFNKLVSRAAGSSPDGESWQTPESERGQSRRARSQSTRTRSKSGGRVTASTRSRATASSGRGRTAAGRGGRSRQPSASAGGRSSPRGQTKRGAGRSKKPSGQVTSIAIRGRTSRSRATSSRKRAA